MRVRVVQIVEDQHHGLVMRRILEEGGQRIEQSEARLLGL
jgi:hypothetical protein